MDSISNLLNLRLLPPEPHTPLLHLLQQSRNPAIRPSQSPPRNPERRESGRTKPTMKPRRFSPRPTPTSSPRRTSKRRANSQSPHRRVSIMTLRSSCCRSGFWTGRRRVSFWTNRARSPWRGPKWWACRRRRVGAPER